MLLASRREFARTSAWFLALPAWSLALRRPLRGEPGDQSATTNASILTPSQMQRYLRTQQRFKASQKLLRAFPLPVGEQPDFVFRATR